VFDTIFTSSPSLLFVCTHAKARFIECSKSVLAESSLSLTLPQCVQVLKALRHGPTGSQSCAVKMSLPDAVSRLLISHEFDMHHAIGGHSNTMALLDAVVLGDVVVALVLPLCEGGTLAGAKQRLLHQNGELNKKLFLKLFQQFAEGLAHVHAKGLVHHDIKDENTLLQKDDTVIVSDFGLATMAGTVLQGYFGTLKYIAPEVLTAHLRGELYTTDPAQDIWSTGVMFFSLLCEDPVMDWRMYVPGFQDMDEQQRREERCKHFLTLCHVYENIMAAAPSAKARLDDTDIVSVSIAELLQECLNHDPARRPTAAELVSWVESLIALEENQQV
jgi:serine/threonine protein kinase